MLLQLGQSTDVEISNSLIQNFQQYISNTLNVLSKKNFSNIQNPGFALVLRKSYSYIEL